MEISYRKIPIFKTYFKKKKIIFRFLEMNFRFLIIILKPI